MMDSIFLPLLGGVIIGLAAAGMMAFLGRIAGISGIVSGILTPKKGDISWRVLFVAGLVVGGGVMAIVSPGSFAITVERSFGAVAVAGLLVGFGTRLGSGCTSGHGICGLSRLSPRSIIATLTFMTTGIVTVYIVRHVFQGAI